MSRTGAVLILAGLMILACSPLSTGRPAPEAARWELAPLAIDVQPAGAGWLAYSIELALTNGGSAAGAPPAATEATIEVTGGERYEARVEGLNDWYIPAGFSVAGSVRVPGDSERVEPIIMHMRVPEDLQPVRALIEGYEPADLSGTATIAFPTSQDADQFRSIGDTVALMIGAEVTLREAQLTGTTLRITYRYQNLSPNYDMTPYFGCTLFGGDGLIRAGMWGPRSYYTPLAPDQRIDRTIDYPLGAHLHAEQARQVASSGKLVCVGDYDGKGRYDTRAIFNIILA